MPYRNDHHLDTDQVIDEIRKELDSTRKSLLAVKLTLVAAAFLIAIQALSNFWLVRMSEQKTTQHRSSVPAEKPP